MIGIIVAGHGNFPTGIMSAVSLIAGNPEHIKAVDFVKGMSTGIKTEVRRADGGAGDF